MEKEIKTVIMFTCLVVGMVLLCAAKMQYSLSVQKDSNINEYNQNQKRMLRAGYLFMTIAVLTAAINFK